MEKSSIRQPTKNSGDIATPTSASTRRIAFATSAELSAIQADDAHLAESLLGHGLVPVSCVWNDPGADWSSFDAVLIRTIWDYFEHYPAFLGWLDRLDQLGVPAINDSALLRWNSNKRYLLELAGHGATIIPSRLASAGELGSVLTTMRGQRVVIKPTTSGGAWHTVRGIVGDSALVEAVAGLPPGLDYLVQPFVEEITTGGEWSLVYVAGRFSHAVLKHPAAGDYRVQEEHGGTVVAVEPDTSTRAAAERALQALTALGYGDHAYARIDGVVCAGRFLVMEVELLEPFLYLAGFPAAAERLALDIATRLTA